MDRLKIAALLALLYPACVTFTASSEHDGGAGDAGAESADAGSAGASAEAGAVGEAGEGGGAGASSAGTSALGGSGGDSSVGGSGNVSGSGGMSAGGACQMSLCQAGKVDTATQACGACQTGKQSHTRTCNADQCSWSAWSAWSECSGVTAACTPGATTACTNKDSCGQRVCSSTCTWSACQPKVAGGCLRIREGHTDEGSNYRCCGSAGHWQFCNSSCKWNTSCAACAKGSPDYCTECY